MGATYSYLWWARQRRLVQFARRDVVRKLPLYETTQDRVVVHRRTFATVPDRGRERHVFLQLLGVCMNAQNFAPGNMRHARAGCIGGALHGWRVAGQPPRRVSASSVDHRPGRNFNANGQSPGARDRTRPVGRDGADRPGGELYAARKIRHSLPSAKTRKCASTVTWRPAEPKTILRYRSCVARCAW